MATAKISDTGTTWFRDGDSNTFTKSGSDNALISIGFAKHTASFTTDQPNTFGAATIVDDKVGTVTQITSPYITGVIGHVLDGNVPEVSSALAYDWSGAALNTDFSGAIILLSGVDQTTPVTFGDEEFLSASAATALTYSCDAGDTVVYMYVDNVTISPAAPTVTGGGSFTGLVTDPNTGDSQIDEGNIWIDENVASSRTNATVFSDNGSTTGYHMVFVINAAAAAGASVDDVNTDEIVEDAETGVTLTVSNFGSDINSFKIKEGANESSFTSLSGTGGSYTANMPDISAITSDTPGCPMTTANHTIEFEASDGTDTATLAGTFNPQAGWAVVETLSADKDITSVFKDFPGLAPTNQSQCYYPTANNTSVAANGDLTSDQITGSITMKLWDIDDGNWKTFDVILSESSSISAISSGIKKGITNGINQGVK